MKINGEKMKNHCGEKINLQWHPVFTDPDFEFPQDENPWRVMAQAYAAWGNAHMGGGIPDNFGMGMAKVGQFLGCDASPDGLNEQRAKWKQSPPVGFPSKESENEK